MKLELITFSKEKSQGEIEAYLVAVRESVESVAWEDLGEGLAGVLEEEMKIDLR